MLINKYQIQRARVQCEHVVKPKRWMNLFAFFRFSFLVLCSLLYCLIVLWESSSQSVVVFV